MKNDKILYIIMGIPGSGKSYTAEQLVPKDNIFTTDDFFMKNGQYMFAPGQIKEAHQWNQDRTENAMRQGITPLCVPNTNITSYDRRAYINMARRYGYDWEITFPTSSWFAEVHPRLRDNTFTNADVKLFYEKNTHNVPLDIIHKMMSRWDESNV